jgi:ubiquitin-protein ligase
LLSVYLDKNKEFSDSNKQKAKELCEELLKLAEQTKNSDLKKQILINISVLFNEKEIAKNFNSDVSQQLRNTRTEISREV